MSGSVEELRARVEVLELRVEDLTQLLQQLRLEQRRVAPASSGYQVVSSAAASDFRGGSAASSVSSNGNYNLLAAEIPEVPDFAARLCVNLRSGSLSSRDRAKRAWECGWWARFCLEERISKPRPSVPVDLANSIYVVLKAERIEAPVVVYKSADYRALVQDFKGPSLSHGFPSQAEAKVYCLGAGIEFPTKVFEWSPQQQ